MTLDFGEEGDRNTLHATVVKETSHSLSVKPRLPHPLGFRPAASLLFYAQELDMPSPRNVIHLREKPFRC